jgi:hypothetical protein
MGQIHIIAAKGDGNIEFWAVAGTPETALTEVLRSLPPGWIVTLTGESITPEEAATLDVHSAEPQKLWAAL